MENRHKIEHYEGCLLGGAVGDALGAPVEFMSLDDILRRFGPSGIVDYAPVSGKTGAITDDTQMTLFTAEGMLRSVTRWRHKGVCYPPAVVYYSYQRWLMTQDSSVDKDGDVSWLMDIPELHSERAPGSSCLSALRSSRQGSMKEPINDSKGCGGVMRIAPVGLTQALEIVFETGCEVAALTHGHPTGYLAAGCLAQIIRHIIDGYSLIQAIEATQAILAEQRDCEECRDAIGAALLAWRRKQPSFETVETLGEGWIAEEALAIGIYCALVGGDDFERGVTLAVNHSGDSDSTGAITGNIMGALLGVSAIPQRYLDQLELKDVITELADDLYTGFKEGDGWWNKYPGSGLYFRSKEEDVEHYTVPFDRCYWVVPGKLMAGCYPGGLNKEEARKTLQGLLDHGIRHVVSLMEPDEKDHAGKPFISYEPLMQSLAIAAGKAVTFARFPIKDQNIPTEDEMVGILDHIGREIDASIPVYVHCWGGKGRTGTVVGCYLARHGLASGKSALRGIQELRRDVADAHHASPETDPQKKMVISWARGQ
ncbi:ADP-ribosylglycohydrolase family protein [Desulfosudis oleivorans]|uniref:ADP-ribosylation/Crystallin J1 n=1 Tax=Desulfosudis oleivorans (strain DSM 6200 / JCM 39069 / Hxd3) TaxID=96561 RepID=A8ZS57_DESOH|nr:ADP-ribosylglycohydrolase family protein [Desulfosudis oleivorans]ABW66075.1 ADP-ribosylation/Crystallin J1 [Desulfosudis oleivorans Hxd3]